MEQIQNFADVRQLGWCVHCGGPTGTRDHAPSRVLLDDPLPENLPVVPACRACNEGFSLDEEYLACLLDCVIAGSTEVTRLARPKVRRLLADKPALVCKIELSRERSADGCSFEVELDRVRKVIVKLARGHALFELNMLPEGTPSSLTILPLLLLSAGQLENFETPPSVSILPEVGSRGMQRLICTGDVGYAWVTVQEGRYRYLAAVDDGIVVRIVLSEYLACEISWDDRGMDQSCSDTSPTREA